jgi:hypothetical protein
MIQNSHDTFVASVRSLDGGTVFQVMIHANGPGTAWRIAESQYGKNKVLSVIPHQYDDQK